MTDAKSSLNHKAYQGFNNYLILPCYFWMILALLVLYRSVTLSEHRIPFAPHAFALLNALVLAKVILIAQKIVGEWFNETALIYTTLLKSAVCGVLLG
jgi:hypothetical protein